MAPVDSDSARVLVHDAGLVLVNPYLPHLFERTGMLTQGRMIPGQEGRAGSLLTYVVLGAPATECVSPLILILCGLAPDVRMHGDALATEDLQTADSMLEAMRRNWPEVRGSSIAQLRQTFFQREGRLDRSTADRVDLQVERKTVDVLLDRLPWRFSSIHHTWMRQPLKVSW